MTSNKIIMRKWTNTIPEEKSTKLWEQNSWVEDVQVWTKKLIREAIDHNTELKETYSKAYYFWKKDKISLISTDKYIFMFGVNEFKICLNDDLAEDNVDVFIIRLIEIIQELESIRDKVFRQTAKIVSRVWEIEKEEELVEEWCTRKIIRDKINWIVRTKSKLKEIFLLEDRLDLIIRVKNELENSENYYSKEDSSNYAIDFYNYFLELLTRTRAIIINIENSLKNEIKAEKSLCKLYWIQV